MRQERPDVDAKGHHGASRVVVRCERSGLRLGSAVMKRAKKNEPSRWGLMAGRSDTP